MHVSQEWNLKPYMLSNNLRFGLDKIELCKSFRFCVDYKLSQHMLAVANDK